MNLTRQSLVQIYPWASRFSLEEQDLIIARLQLWGRSDVDTDTFLDKLIHTLIDQDIVLGHFKFGLRESLEDGLNHGGQLSTTQLRQHFYKVIHYVKD